MTKANNNYNKIIWSIIMLSVMTIIFVFSNQEHRVKDPFLPSIDMEYF